MNPLTDKEEPKLASAKRALRAAKMVGPHATITVNALWLDRVLTSHDHLQAKVRRLEERLEEQ